MPKQPEGKLVARIKKLAHERGARCFKIVGSDESFQEVGIPDLLICYRGIFVGMEVKQPGASLRPAQRVVLFEIYTTKGVAAVVETEEQVDRLLSYLEDWSPFERHTGLCFDRGKFRSAFKLD